MLNRIFIASFYALFTIVAGVKPSFQDTSKPEHACCCNASSACCNATMPMDCCVDDSEDLPATAQLVSAEFRLDILPIAVTQKQVLHLPVIRVSTTETKQHHPPQKERVKRYKIFHRLIFYA